MNAPSFQIVSLAAVLLGFGSCAGDPNGGRPPVHAEPMSSAGTRFGEGVASGCKYVVGLPFLTLCTVFAPLGGGSPADVLPKFQELADGPASKTPPSGAPTAWLPVAR